MNFNNHNYSYDHNDRDNIIQWIFEKAFCHITINGAELYLNPFEKILIKTFHNQSLHEIIANLTNRTVQTIKTQLTNNSFMENFLFKITKKKLHVQILLNNMDKIKHLVTVGHTIDDKSIQLTIINNKIEFLKYFLEFYKPRNEMLMYCSEFGYTDIYQYLRNKGLVPNISVYKKAILSNSLEIIKDISEHIGLSNKILELAFQTNDTNIILFLLEQANTEGMKFDTNLISYPILNNNMELLQIIETKHIVQKQPIDWHIGLFHSAILSGSMEMVKYLEFKIPDIHTNHMADMSRTKRGEATLLLDDIIYTINGKKYFSHCMNYAVQSGSLDMVKYIHESGYGITPSNFITSIKQGTVEIIEYLSKSYHKELPDYFFQYFGIKHYALDKIKKAQILVEHGLLKINSRRNLNMNDHRKNSIHFDMINSADQIDENNIMDVDYLMGYNIFFGLHNMYRNKIIAKIRICLGLNLVEDLEKLVEVSCDKQLVLDTIFLFGNVEQVRKFGKVRPDDKIIMEIICYGQIDKLQYLVENGLNGKEFVSLIIALDDVDVNKFFEGINVEIDGVGMFIIQSGKKDKIIKYFENYRPNKNVLEKLLLLDDLDILKMISIPKEYLQDLVDFAERNDLFEIWKYLEISR